MRTTTKIFLLFLVAMMLMSPAMASNTEVVWGESCSLPTGNSYSSLVCRHMVAEGMGISFTTLHTSRMVPEGLRYVPLETPDGPWTVGLYWRKNRKLTEDEETFRRFVEAFYRRKKRQA